MKKNFNSSILQRIARGIASFGALFTMVMAPVAQGAQVENFSKVQMQNVLDQMGLNKQITIGEFYNKNKHLFPARIQKEIEPMMMNNKNQMMPQVEIVMAKGSDGRDVPNMRFTQGNELLNVQWFGEENKYVKFQNTNLTEVDLANFNDVFTRVTNGDERIRKQFTPEVSQKDVGTYPSITNETWKAMSQKNRMAYVMNMRLLWNDARKVLIENDKLKNKGRKTSALDVNLEKLDNFFAMIGQVEAAGRQVKDKVPSSSIPKGTAPTVKANAGSSAFVSGANCIVAGYVSKYSANKCGIENMKDSYKDSSGAIDPLVDSANKSCGGSQIACNPYVYGTPGGKAICVSTSDPSFQVATHYDGPCDLQSRLGSNATILKEDIKNGERYGSGNILSKEELEKKFKEEQKSNPKLVEDYLNGLIAYNKSAGIDFTKPLTDDSLRAILNIKSAFDNDIGKARESCKIAAGNKTNEKNFWGACDQLHRRYLNVAQFLQDTPGCKDGTKTINPDTLKCICPTPLPEALPGTSCGVTPPICPAPAPTPIVVTPPPVCVPGPVTPPVDPKPPAPPKENCEKYGEIGLNDQCKCPNGAAPALEVGDGDGPSVYKCVPKKSGADRDKDHDKDCGFLCKTGQFLKNNGLLIALGIGTTFAAWKLLTPKKVKTNPAKDVCPDGTTNGGSCVQACGIKVWNASAGACTCAECPAGQSANATTCVCSTGAVTPPSGMITCPDGVNQAASLEACPARTIKCWDGSTVQGTSDLNCPEKPSATKAQPSRTNK